MYDRSSEHDYTESMATEPKKLPEVRNLAVRVLRTRRKETQVRLAEKIGVTKTAITRMETGDLNVSPKTLWKIASVLGFSREETETLLFGLAAFLGTVELPAAAASLTAADCAEIARESARRGGAEMKAVVERKIAEAQAQQQAQERAEAAKLLREIAHLPLLKQQVLIEDRADFHTWAVVEKLCEESARAATDNPKLALQLASIALRCSREDQIIAPLRHRLEGYAWAFVGNARRVLSDLPSADEAFFLAWLCWRKGKRIGAALPLGAWRMCDLEASLRRAQFRGRRALILLNRALKAAPTSEQGRLLLIKATTHEMMGQVGKAVSSLLQAAEWVVPEREPQLYFALRFNLAVDLELAGRPEEANALIPELRERATALRSDVSLTRVLWLQARIQASLGDLAEATAALDQVRREFCRREMAYDAALVSLELAVLLLDQGEMLRVKDLANETLWIFRAQGVDRAMLAALKLFCEAAQQQTITASLVRDSLRQLREQNLFSSTAPIE
jgi:transcriptional regulator with XRE-family HTH domain